MRIQQAEENESFTIESFTELPPLMEESGYEDSAAELHPLLDKTDKKRKEEEEREDNMVVLVEYRGITYKVDFTKESEDYQLLPRQLKKMIALEDIQQHVDAEEASEVKAEDELRQLAKSNSKQYNRMMQNEKQMGIVERLRTKLMLRNPLRKDIKHEDD